MDDISQQIGFRFLPPKSKVTPRRKIFVAFDTETDNERFVCGAYYGIATTRRGIPLEISEYCDTQEDFQHCLVEIETLFAKNRQAVTFVGFNTSYDLAYLQPVIDSSERLDAGSKFVMTKTKNGNNVYDVGNHVIGTLESWIERLNLHEELGIHKREGYLDSLEGKRAQVLDDACATYHLSEWVQNNLITKFGVPFKPTKFGAALEIFRRNYFTGAWYRTNREKWKHDYEREGYYGGRCEIFRRGEQTVQSYDVNSMYVAIMRDEKVPNPSKTVYTKDAAEIEDLIESGEHLMVRGRVTVPKCIVGSLPYRQKETGKLIFPWGTWEGVYHSHELRTAFEYGAELSDIKNALYYPETDYYFRDFATMTLEGRKQAKLEGDNATEQLYKYYGNGLYGKFGQRNGGGKRYIRLEEYSEDVVGLTIIEDAFGEPWVQEDESKGIDALHSFPVVSATVTALARAKLLKPLMMNEEVIVYCDTDSVKLCGYPDGIPISKEPGDWDYEYEATQVFYGPKMYADKRKGVPRKAIQVFKDGNVEIYEFERPVTFKESLRRKVPQNTWETRRKVVTCIDTKRAWNDDDTSYPLKIIE